MMVFWLKTILICCVFSFSATVAAQEHGHAEHKNEIAGFVGLTHERRENGLALGVEYKRRITPGFGIGLLAERTWGDFDFWVFAVPFSKTFDKWSLIVAPGIEESEEEDHPMLRLGVGYELEIGESKPQLGFAVDFVDGEHVFVLGVAYGIGF